MGVDGGQKVESGPLKQVKQRSRHRFILHQRRQRLNLLLGLALQKQLSFAIALYGSQVEIHRQL
jgi:hypothetical protein